MKHENMLVLDSRYRFQYLANGEFCSDMYSYTCTDARKTHDVEAQRIINYG